MTLVFVVGIRVFASAFAVKNKAQGPSGSGGTEVGIGSMDGQGMVGQQVAGLSGAGYFLAVFIFSEIHDALGEPKSLRASMRTHSIEM